MWENQKGKINMREFIISDNDANQRLDKFLQKAVPLLGKSLMYKYIRIKRIKLNGKRCSFSDKLEVGDTISLYINDEYFEKPKYDFLTSGSELDIVFEDKNIMIVNKPTGLVVHADEQNSADTLIGRILKYFYEKKEYDPQKENSFAPALCNRIDRNTSGLVICAKNAEALRELNEIIKQRYIKKEYLCVCVGSIPKKQFSIEGYLFKNEKTKLVSIYDKPRNGAKKIITKAELLKSNNNLSLCRVDLVTGRTHQIRASFAHIGFPLLGDGKYGNGQANKKYHVKTQALHSYSMKFELSGKQQDFPLLAYLNNQQFFAQKPWFLKYFD